MKNEYNFMKGQGYRWSIDYMYDLLKKHIENTGEDEDNTIHFLKLMRTEVEKELQLIHKLDWWPMIFDEEMEEVDDDFNIDVVLNDLDDKKVYIMTPEEMESLIQDARAYRKIHDIIIKDERSRYILRGRENEMSMSSMSTVGKRILDLLASNNMSQRQLAKAVGVTEVSISRYIHGDRIPNARVMFSIAHVLGTTSHYLLTGNLTEKEGGE